MLITDSHCHLDQFEDPAAVLREAALAGVSRLVTMGQDEASMGQALALADAFPRQVLAAVGVHPVHVVESDPPRLEASLAFLARHAADAAAIGETGLDHRWAVDTNQQAAQERVLERHFELAAQHRKPVNLHSRRCQRQVMERAITFHRDTGLHAQLHWFTQSKKLIRATNDAGIFISAGPAVVDDPHAATVACTIDDDLLLLETDAPVPVGGVAGHPARAREVVTKLASLKGVDERALARRTQANFERFLTGAA